MFKKGYTPWNKGRKHSKKTKEKIRKTNLGKHSSPKTEFKKGQNLGENNSSWKGGKKKSGNRWFIYKPEHPFARKNYVLQSRLIAEKCLGRYLTEIETIHHINGNTLDDKSENLYLFESKGNHTTYHKLKIKEIITKSNLG